MEKYTCPACSYEYNPDSSEEASKLPDKSFMRLPSDWLCPICGAPKDKFKES